MNKYCIVLLTCLVGTGSMMAMNNKIVRGVIVVPPLYTLKLVLDKVGKNSQPKPKAVSFIKKPSAQYRFECMLRSHQDY